MDQNRILIFKEVLKKEAPLNEKWFLRRIVHLFGRSVVNSTVTDMYNEKMSGCAYNGIKREKGFLYLEIDRVEKLTYSLLV